MSNYRSVLNSLFETAMAILYKTGALQLQSFVPQECTRGEVSRTYLVVVAARRDAVTYRSDRCFSGLVGRFLRVFVAYFVLLNIYIVRFKVFYEAFTQ